MSETTLVRHCAPTLAGLKTGSLFNCRYDQLDVLLHELTQLNRDLRHRQAQPILSEAGYENSDCGTCIRRLICRLHADGGFPHEVGLFLGYPPEDVRGFIENRAQNYKLAGDWKVYGDADRARRIFTQYKICTQCYCKALDAGVSLRQLAVAT